MSDLLEFVINVLVELLDLFRWWRLCLCLAASAAVFSMLHWLLPGSRTGFWISVSSVVISLTLGLIWEWRAADKQTYWS